MPIIRPQCADKLFDQQPKELWRSQRTASNTAGPAARACSRRAAPACTPARRRRAMGSDRTRHRTATLTVKRAAPP
eukprot:3852380-Pleurochrysis_carterae.AAC.2